MNERCIYQYFGGLSNDAAGGAIPNLTEISLKKKLKKKEIKKKERKKEKAKMSDDLSWINSCTFNLGGAHDISF